MGVPTRFINGGVTNASKPEPFGMMGQLDPTKFNSFFEDFHYSDVAAATPLDWTVTKVGVGTVTVASEDGAAMLFTNAAADNDSVAAQLKNPGFVLNSGKQSWFEARMKISDITQSDLLIGLTGLDTTPIGAAASEETGVADGIFFLKIDAATDWRFYTRKASATVASKTAIATMTLAYQRVGWHYNGKDEFRLFFNGVHVASLAALFATQVPALIVGPQFMVQNGEAVAKTCTLDYIFAAQER